MKKITIEVPTTWLTVVPGSQAADQVVEKVQELMKEQLPSKYEQWKALEGLGVSAVQRKLDSMGFMEWRTKLYMGSIQAIDALVMARAVLARIVDEDTEAAVGRIDSALYDCLPGDVVEEIRAWNPIRGQVTEFPSRD